MLSGQPPVRSYTATTLRRLSVLRYCCCVPWWRLSLLQPKTVARNSTYVRGFQRERNATVHQAKRHSPIGPHCDGPNTFTIAFERMKSKRRLVHILYVGGLIECREDQTQAVNVIGFEFAPVILFKETSQALMFKTLDQLFRV
jgi:hypothetical protein